MKISIITVCYNAGKTIEKTIISVLNQTYHNIEYIIIDGGSTDGSVDIIKKYADKLAYWVTEPDKGIYDAMNKGILVATGEWVNFMNAGDTFYDNNVIFNIFRSNYPDYYMVIYGGVKAHHHWGTYIEMPRHLNNLKYGMISCHQSTFIRLSKHKKLLYDTSFKISADYDFFHKIYMENPGAFIEYKGVISEYDGMFGVSSINKFSEEGKKFNVKKPLILRVKIWISNHLSGKIRNFVFRTVWTFNCRYKRMKD